MLPAPSFPFRIDPHRRASLHLVLAICFLAPLFSVSCQSLRKDNGTALKELAVIAGPEHPPFAATGSIRIQGGGADYSGSITLALSAGKYRLEIFDVAGKTIKAVAGEQGRMTEVNPSTGEKNILSGPLANVVRLERFRIPVSILGSIVYGTTPTFERIVLKSDGEGEIVVDLGPLAPGPSTPYVSSFKLSFPGEGVEAVVRWKNVRQNVEFPEGFFSFEETGDGLAD